MQEEHARKLKSVFLSCDCQCTAQFANLSLELKNFNSKDALLVGISPMKDGRQQLLANVHRPQLQ